MKFSKYKVNIPGPYHIKNGIPCQDAYCIRETPDGVIVAAVADGLGSERLHLVLSLHFVNRITSQR